MERLATNNIDEKIHFAVIAIEASAASMGVTPTEMYNRLNKVDLIDRLLLGCYDVMHCQSTQIVAEDVCKALRNWEAKSSV